MVNATAGPHAMYLRRHHFRAIASGCTAGPVRATRPVEREAAVEIAFVADNPGDWPLHRHMPEHSAAGMKTWFRVS